MNSSGGQRKVRSPIIGFLLPVLSWWVTPLGLIGGKFLLEFGLSYFVPNTSLIGFVYAVAVCSSLVAFVPVRLADGTWTRCRRSLIRRFPLRRLRRRYAYYEKINGRWTLSSYQYDPANGTWQEVPAR